MRPSGFGSTWKPFHMVELELVYLGITIISGVINSNGKTLNNFSEWKLWETDIRGNYAKSTGLRLDSAEDRVERRQRYKLAPVSKV